MRTFQKSHEDFQITLQRIENLRNQLVSMFEDDAGSLEDCKRQVDTMKEIIEQNEAKTLMTIHGALLDLNHALIKKGKKNSAPSTTTPSIETSTQNPTQTDSSTSTKKPYVPRYLEDPEKFLEDLYQIFC